MSDITKNDPQIRYTLDIRTPKKLPQRIDVVEAVAIGSDPRNDIIVSHDEGFNSKQFIFRMRANTLIGINLSGEEDVLLNRAPMIEGKHYLLEKGDSISLNSVEIIIRQDSTTSLAKGLENSNPQLKFLNNAKKEASGSAKIKKRGTSSISISLESLDSKEKKQGFMDKLKSLFQKPAKKTKK